MWKPVIDRGDGMWVGTTELEGLWIGDVEAAQSRVVLEEPVSLWPLLERRYEDVRRELESRWSDLLLDDGWSPIRLLESVIASAVRSDRSYWASLALEWASRTPNDAGSHDRVISALRASLRSKDLSQKVRHQAYKILKDMGQLEVK